MTEIKQMVFFLIDVDGEEVEGVKRGDLQDAQGRHGIREAKERRQIVDALHPLRMTDGDASRGQFQGVGDALGQVRRQRAAADQEDSLRIGIIELNDLVSDGFG